MAAAHTTLEIIAPIATRAASVNDGVLLNHLLTLEHLENAFYYSGVAQFSQKDFENAGVTNPLFYSELKDVSHRQTTHVACLTSAVQSTLSFP